MSDSNTYDLGGGGNSFAFDHIGDSVTGKIVDFEERQQTDIKTGSPLVWDDGRAKMMLHIDLATSLREHDGDDGIRGINIRGSKKPESKTSLAAVAGAVKDATGGNSIQVGATLTLTYVGDGPVTQKGFNAPKLYTAAYTPKQASVSEKVAEAQVVAKSEPTALTPEQMAALIAKAQPAAAVDVIAAHPQGAALRAAGVPDDVIKASLGLA